MPNYPKEQLWELYENLPKELQSAIFSAETADKIYDICARNGVTDEKLISEIAKNSGYVLLGVLPLNDLQPILERELRLDKNSLKQIVWEINRFIFLAVKDDLEALYKIEITPAAPNQETISEKEIKISSSPENSKIKRTRKKDTYRETVE